MKRIRRLGLAALLPLALLILPGIASASGGVEADKYPLHFRITAEEPNSVWFGVEGEANPSYCGKTLIGGGEIAGPSATMGGITGLSCHEVGGSEKELKMNGCSFELRPGSENSANVGPPGCGPITELKVEACTSPISIPAQTGVPATYENVIALGAEAVKVRLISAYLKFTGTGNCAAGGIVGFNGNWTFNGYDGAMLDNIRSTDGFDGLYIAGKKSETEAEQPKFTSETYPNPVTGSLNSGSAVKFNLGSGNWPVTCSAASFSSALTAASAVLPLTAGLTNCIAFENEAVSVAMHSCTFKYGVSNISSPYKGTLGIGCTSPGDSIELKSAGCTAKIPAQSPATSTASYENQGSGRTRSILVNSSSVEKLSYTFEKFPCELLGKEHTDGKLTIGAATLRGS